MPRKDPKAAREYAREYREKNPEKARESVRRWHEKNPSYSSAHYASNIEDERAKRRLWHEENKDRSRELNKRWRDENPDARRAKCARQRAARQSAPQGDPREIAQREAELREEPCVACGSTNNITIDHILPISRGGAHDVDNLQALCGSCNSSKGAKTMEEWCPTLA